MGGREGSRGEGGGIKELNVSKKPIKKYQTMHTGYKQCSDYHKKQLTVLQSFATGKTKLCDGQGWNRKLLLFVTCLFVLLGCQLYTHITLKNTAENRGGKILGTNFEK